MAEEQDDLILPMELPTITKQRLEKIRQIIQRQRLEQQQQQQQMKTAFVPKVEEAIRRPNVSEDDDSDRIRIYYDMPLMLNCLNLESDHWEVNNRTSMSGDRQKHDNDDISFEEPRRLQPINPITFTRKIIDLRPMSGSSNSIDSSSSSASIHSIPSASLESLEDIPLPKVNKESQSLPKISKPIVERTKPKATKLIAPIVEQPKPPEKVVGEIKKKPQPAPISIQTSPPPPEQKNPIAFRPLPISELKLVPQETQHCNHITSNPYSKEEIRRYILEKKQQRQQQQQIKELSARLVKEKVAENKRILLERLSKKKKPNTCQPTIPKALAPVADVPDGPKVVCDRETEMSFINLKRPDTEGAEAMEVDQSVSTSSKTVQRINGLHLAELLAKLLEDSENVPEDLFNDFGEDEYLKLPTITKKKKKKEISTPENEEVNDGDVQREHSLIIRHTTTTVELETTEITSGQRQQQRSSCVQEKLRRLYAQSEQLLQETDSLICVASSRSTNVFGHFGYAQQQQQPEVEDLETENDEVDEEMDEEDCIIEEEVADEHDQVDEIEDEEVVDEHDHVDEIEDEEEIEEEDEEIICEEAEEDEHQPALLESPSTSVPASPLSPVEIGDNLFSASPPKSVPCWSELCERVFTQSSNVSPSQSTTTSSTTTTTCLPSSPLDAVYPKNLANNRLLPSDDNNSKFIEFYNAPTNPPIVEATSGGVTTAQQSTPMVATTQGNPIQSAVEYRQQHPGQQQQQQQQQDQPTMMIANAAQPDLEHIGAFDIEAFIKAQAHRVHILRKDYQLLERTNQHLNIPLPMIIKSLELRQTKEEKLAYKAFLFDLVKEVIIERFNFETRPPQPPITTLVLPLKAQRRPWPSSSEGFCQAVLDYCRKEWPHLFRASANRPDTIGSMYPSEMDQLPETRRKRLRHLGLVAFCRHQRKMETVDMILYREMRDDEHLWVGGFQTEIEEIQSRIVPPDAINNNNNLESSQLETSQLPMNLTMDTSSEL